MNCTSCKKPISEIAKFCSGCGGKVCPDCHNTVNRDKKYCNKCGYEFPQAQLQKSNSIPGKCRNCGVVLKGNNECSNCGYVNPVEKENVILSTPPPPPKPGKCAHCSKQNGAGIRFCMSCHKQLPNPIPPVRPPIKQGECAACHTQNDPGVKICKKCRKPIPHPLPPIKQVPSKKQAGVYSAKVMERRRVTIPKQVCEALILEEGNYVTFSLEMNTVTFAKSRSQKGKKQA